MSPHARIVLTYRHQFSHLLQQVRQYFRYSDYDKKNRITESQVFPIAIDNKRFEFWPKFRMVFPERGGSPVCLMLLVHCFVGLLGEEPKAKLFTHILKELY